MQIQSDDSNIIFLTTTIGTRWIFYQQFLLNKFFPSAKKVLIDGNLNWNFNLGVSCVWYEFIRITLQNKGTHKYFVHIDEDCFITNPNGILELINVLENENVDLIGPSDVFYRIRGANPIALNSFLMIGKVSALEEVMQGFDVSLKFKQLHIPIDPSIEEYRIEFEPYYNFFWNYFKKGFKITYFQHCFDEQYTCTSLLDSSGYSFGVHMWFTREWRRKKKLFGVSHYRRYKNMKYFLRKRFKISFWRLLVHLRQPERYLVILYSRLVPKKVLRLKRKLLIKSETN